MSEKIIVDIFKGSVKDEMYLYVKRDEAFKRVPEVLLNGMGELSKVMTIPLHSERPLARADIKVVLQALNEKGFYLQMPPVETEPALVPGRD